MASERNPMRATTSWGQVLQLFRLRNQLTQRELANMIGYSRSTIAHIEQGRRLPGPQLVSVLLDTLNLTPEETVILRRQVAQLTPEKTVTTPVTLQMEGLPLRPSALANVVSAFSSLYTKCWLCMRGNYKELVEYAQGNTLQVEQADALADLLITSLSYHSPALIKFDNLLKPIADVLTKIIEHGPLIRQNIRAAQLENRRTELEIDANYEDREQERRWKELREEQNYRWRENQIRRQQVRDMLSALKELNEVLPQVGGPTHEMIIEILLPDVSRLVDQPDLTLAEPRSRESNMDQF